MGIIIYFNPQTEYIIISPVLLWCHKGVNIFDYQNARHDIKHWYLSSLCIKLHTQHGEKV
jgi:hypothetical protein